MAVVATVRTTCHPSLIPLRRALPLCLLRFFISDKGISGACASARTKNLERSGTVGASCLLQFFPCSRGCTFSSRHQWHFLQQNPPNRSSWCTKKLHDGWAQIMRYLLGLRAMTNVFFRFVLLATGSFLSDTGSGSRSKMISRRGSCATGLRCVHARTKQSDEKGSSYRLSPNSSHQAHSSSMVLQKHQGVESRSSMNSFHCASSPEGSRSGGLPAEIADAAWICMVLSSGTLKCNDLKSHTWGYLWRPQILETKCDYYTAITYHSPNVQRSFH
jgi:hypothetical protein